MSKHTFLQSFDVSAQRLEESRDQELLEAAKVKAYEAGYASGWDDAMASDKTSRMRLEAEFERNVQNLAFTFAEAVSHVREELQEFLTEIITKFFPEVTPIALREHIKSELQQMGDSLTDVPVEIVSSPDCNSTVADMLKSDFGIEIQLVEDASLSDGQVYLRLGSKEIEIDLEPLISAVSEQLKAIVSSTEEGAEDV